jgi:hypothetical protein
MARPRYSNLAYFWRLRLVGLAVILLHRLLWRARNFAAVTGYAQYWRMLAVLDVNSGLWSGVGEDAPELRIVRIIGRMRARR